MSKEKQIDEIAKLICNFPQCVCYNSIGECANTECQIVDKAEALYNAGYRKQSEIIRCKDCAFGEIDAEGSGSVQCQNRDTPWRRYKEEFVMSPHDYCSYARAKMKGGE